MKLSLTTTLGSLLVCVWPGMVQGQTARPSGSTALDAIVVEVRLLRQTVERQAVAAARAQLIVARLALYDQRAARARQAVDRQEGDLASAERERTELQMAAHESARGLEQATEPERREQLEAESRMLRSRLNDLEKLRPTIEARLVQAKQELDAENARYDELERWLNDLDQQLQPRP